MHQIQGHRVFEKILLHLKAHIGNHTPIVGDFNISFLLIIRSYKERLNREKLDITDNMIRTDLTDTIELSHKGKRIFLLLSPL